MKSKRYLSLILLFTIFFTACATTPASPTATNVPSGTPTVPPTETTLPTATPPTPTASSTFTPKPTATKEPTATPSPEPTELSPSIDQPTQALVDLIPPDPLYNEVRNDFLPKIESQFEGGGLRREDGIWRLNCIAAADMKHFEELIQIGDEIFTHGIPCQYKNAAGKEVLVYIPALRFNLVEKTYQALGHHEGGAKNFTEARKAFNDERGPLELFLKTVLSYLYRQRLSTRCLFYRHFRWWSGCYRSKCSCKFKQSNIYKLLLEFDPNLLYEQLYFQEKKFFLALI